MTVRPQRIRYLKSLALELQSQATRVRDLIGDSHWLSDGHHKEYLLLSVLSRHLPTGVMASRGFVVSPHDPDQRSTEQDILIVDVSKEAPIFNQGNLIIAFPHQVIASISVKTSLAKAVVGDAICGLASVRDLCSQALDEHFTWYGAYFFTPSEQVTKTPSVLYEWIAAGIKPTLDSPSTRVSLDLLVCGSSLACKVSATYEEQMRSGAYLNGYHCDSLETALFLGHLLDAVSIRRGASESDMLISLDNMPCTPFDVPRYNIT